MTGVRALLAVTLIAASSLPFFVVVPRLVDAHPQRERSTALPIAHLSRTAPSEFGHRVAAPLDRAIVRLSREWVRTEQHRHQTHTRHGRRHANAAR